MQLPQLKRIRWAVRATLILGVAASVAANVLHARPNLISQTISAWPPLALLLTVELTSRIPMHRPVLASLRVLATATIAGIAAWVSYWHMQGVAVHYGETETSAYLLPVSVDGLIVVASVSLVELAGRIRQLEFERVEAAGAMAAVAPLQFVAPVPPQVAVSAPVFQPGTPRPPAARPVSPIGSALRREAAAALSGELDGADEDMAPVSPAVGPVTRPPLSQSIPVSPAVAATTRPVAAYANGSTPVGRRGSARAAVSTPARTVVTSSTTKPAESSAPRPRRPVTETADLADELAALHPEYTEADVARDLGISESRLRQARKEARDAREAAALSSAAG